MATLQEIIQYSKANPNTDYAKRAAKLIQNGDFDTQAQKEGIDLTWAGRPAVQAPAPEADHPVIGFLKSVVSAPATLIARPFQAAQSFGQLLGSDSAGLQKVSEQKTQIEQQLANIKNVTNGS